MLEKGFLPTTGPGEVIASALEPQREQAAKNLEHSGPAPPSKQLAHHVPLRDCKHSPQNTWTKGTFWQPAAKALMLSWTMSLWPAAQISICTHTNTSLLELLYPAPASKLATSVLDSTQECAGARSHQTMRAWSETFSNLGSQLLKTAIVKNAMTETYREL